MKASDAIARYLSAHGVNVCFELVGGMITHLIDSMSSSGRFTIVSMHHEQAAAFAAEGVARQTAGQRVAVAMGTSGPGATNLVTGIGSCWFDSIPCLFITGQVNTHELKGVSSIRQQGFQELDIVSVAGSLTKYAKQINSADAMLPELHRALSMAMTGRKGPVLLDIPNDIQRADLPDEVVEYWANAPFANIAAEIDTLESDQRARLVGLCRAAHRPLVCFGGGSRWAAPFQSWISDLESCGIPYVATLMGQERIKASSFYFKMIGSYGNREANWAVQNCDLLIVIGARLDVRQTGADVADFARQAIKVQVDIDPAQMNNRVKAELNICLDSESFFEQFEITRDLFPIIDKDWSLSLRERAANNDVDEYPEWPVSPHGIFHVINEVMVGQPVDYVCDVGNHQMWAAQGLRLGDGQAIHHSGGMGAMGFALPAAIGVALASRRRTIVITGDGSLQVNSQELDTLNRLGLNITIIVMNNFSLGMVKNFQDMYFDGRDQSTRKGYSCPSFTALARAYGLAGVSVNTEQELRGALSEALGLQGPLLIEILMEGASECRPRLAYGMKLDNQYPDRH